MWKEWLSCSDPVLGICRGSICKIGTAWIVVGLVVSELLWCSNWMSIFLFQEFCLALCFSEQIDRSVQHVGISLAFLRVWRYHTFGVECSLHIVSVSFNVRVETRWWYQSLKDSGSAPHERRFLLKCKYFSVGFSGGELAHSVSGPV